MNTETRARSAEFLWRSRRRKLLKGFGDLCQECGEVVCRVGFCDRGTRNKPHRRITLRVAGRARWAFTRPIARIERRAALHWRARAAVAAVLRCALREEPQP